MPEVISEREPARGNSVRKDCPVCGAVVTRPKKTGRPPTYCSTRCRRAAEASIRRLQVHLTRCEREEQKARLELAMPDNTWRVDKGLARVRADFWRDEITRLRSELADLLDDDTKSDAAVSPVRSA